MRFLISVSVLINLFVTAGSRPASLDLPSKVTSGLVARLEVPSNPPLTEDFFREDKFIVNKTRLEVHNNEPTVETVIVQSERPDYLSLRSHRDLNDTLYTKGMALLLIQATEKELGLSRPYAVEFQLDTIPASLAIKHGFRLDRILVERRTAGSQVEVSDYRGVINRWDGDQPHGSLALVIHQKAIWHVQPPCYEGPLDRKMMDQVDVMEIPTKRFLRRLMMWHKEFPLQLEKDLFAYAWRFRVDSYSSGVKPLDEPIQMSKWSRTDGIYFDTTPKPTYHDALEESNAAIFARAVMFALLVEKLKLVYPYTFTTLGEPLPMVIAKYHGFKARWHSEKEIYDCHISRWEDEKGPHVILTRSYQSEPPLYNGLLFGDKDVKARYENFAKMLE